MEYKLIFASFQMWEREVENIGLLAKKSQNGIKY